MTKYGRGDFNYNHQLFIVIIAVIDMVLNIWTVALPLPVIKNLQIDMKKKVGVSLIFLLGAL
jgi:energy-converting hydrogenase Eha subunit E